MKIGKIPIIAFKTLLEELNITARIDPSIQHELHIWLQWQRANREADYESVKPAEGKARKWVNQHELASNEAGGNEGNACTYQA